MSKKMRLTNTAVNIVDTMRCVGIETMRCVGMTLASFGALLDSVGGRDLAVFEGTGTQIVSEVSSA